MVAIHMVVNTKNKNYEQNNVMVMWMINLKEMINLKKFYDR